uniref:Zinc transporter ZIP8 n=1 Tax=Steinernema glaseri TaxID=37863 RepID=A0A1I8ABA3_9BILA
MSPGDLIPATAASNLYNLTNAQKDELCSAWVPHTAPSTTTIQEHVATHRDRPSTAAIWFVGLSFVTAISLCALVGIAVMRFLRKKIYNRFITFFVGLGVGSLSGSAVFHLIPQAFGLVDEFSSQEVDHDYLYKAAAAIFGIYLFFFCDKVIKMILETKKRNKNEFTELPTLNHSHCHPESSRSQEHLNHTVQLLDAKQQSGTTPLINHQKENDDIYKDTTVLPSNGVVADESIGRQAHGICVHDHDLDYKQGDSVIATVAWMIIFGDGLHNLIDGISIGASFSDSILSGINVSVAVLCEEFPHELGDVAILVSAGMTLRQALVYNLLSALTCYIGFFIGVFLGNVNAQFASYTFAFAAGMFLYISLACMMPEMKNAMEEALQVSLKHGVEVLLLQMSGLVSGLLVMLCMARYGGNISLA